MSRKNDAAFLIDILEAAKVLDQYAKDWDEASLSEDPIRRGAVLWYVSLMGEAVKQLTQEFRILHPEVSWKSIAGMRDRLIHRYNEIDFVVVREVIRVDIPNLIKYIEPLIPPDDEAAISENEDS